jgi:hypothetical protein
MEGLPVFDRGAGAIFGVDDIFLIAEQTQDVDGHVAAISETVRGEDRREPR